MSPESIEERLSRISTLWTELRQAHEGTEEAARAAQEQLLERYRGAVHRYLRRAVGDAADDLTQEFAVALMNGDFRHANPQRGRFRNYVKTALFHLVSKHRRGEAKLPHTLADDDLALTNLAANPQENQEFDQTWRDELLKRTWNALESAQPNCSAVLRFRAANPELRSAQMAQELSRRQGKSLSPDAVRQTLKRARELFVELLLKEVIGSLQAPTVDAITDELRDLHLLDYCKGTLQTISDSKPARPLSLRV